MFSNAKFGEKNAILGAINSAAVAAGTVVSTWVPVRDFHSIAAILSIGTMGASGTIDAKLRQATDSSGTGAKDVTGKAITQIVKASGDNVQALLEVRGDELDGANGFGFVALSVTVGTATSQLAATLIGHNPRFAPASAANPASVVQIVG